MSRTPPRRSSRALTLGSWSRLPMPTAVAEDAPPDGLACAARLSSAGTNGTSAEGGLLPRGAGRSYGDTPVNGGGIALSTASVHQIHSFDPIRGTIEADAGVTLREINALVSQPVGSSEHGWIVPACPGTQSVTLGGMVASDVHGKNHAHAGTIGEHVERLTLCRSDAGRIECSRSRDAHPRWFEATLGGLGLTGWIERVTLRLQPLLGNVVRVQRTTCRDIGETLALLRDTDTYDYGLAWIDSLARTSSRASSSHPQSSRCVVLRASVEAGEWSPKPRGSQMARFAGRLGRLVPPALFRRSTMRLVNEAYFRGTRPFSRGMTLGRAAVSGFLFPQDEAHGGNRLYGRRGVFAHHSLVPAGRDDAVLEILRRAALPGQQSLVTVLKAFGSASRCGSGPGLLSFSGHGTSIALGFPNEGEKTLRQLDGLDDVALDAGGQLYPAKDARMSASAFARSFPRAQEFAARVDPAMSSNFWRRVKPESRP